jgi:hypothetical protein
VAESTSDAAFLPILGTPVVVYALLVGFLLGIAVELALGNLSSSGFHVFGCLETFTQEMETVLRISADPKEEEFPFPNDDKYKLKKKTLPELKSLCRVYKLELAGNKPILLQRLIDFSSDVNAWNRPIAGRRIPHKGPRNITNNVSLEANSDKKPKRKSLLNARRDELMGELAPAEPVRIIQRSKDTRTQQQKDEVLAWAKRFVENNPDIQTPRQVLKEASPKASGTKQEISSRLANIEEQLHTLLSQNTTTSGRSSEAMDIDIEPHLASMPPSLPATSLALPVPPNLSPAPPLSLSHTSPADIITDGTPTAQPFPLAITTRTPPAPNVVMSDASSIASSESMKILILGDETRLQFLSSDVADPPSISFTKDIAKLGRVWDDSHPEFSPTECALRIKGHAVALKHWPTAYSYSHDTRWHGTKKIWDTWKWVAERYHQSTPDDFWAEFYDHDRNQCMTYTAINKLLRERRKEANQCTAQQQRERLGQDFAQQFQVRGKAMVHASAIAKRVEKNGP